MDFQKATASFEAWLRQETRVVEKDLLFKHAAQRKNAFAFFRATYYRWAQQFLALDSAVSAAPTVLAVADLHLENFGAWRDGLGRLAWGINDFDEAYPLPYTNDLVRLTTSVLLAITAGDLRIGLKPACRAILAGYQAGLVSGGRPFVIGDDPRWFQPIRDDPPSEPGRYWGKLHRLHRESARLPVEAVAALEAALPAPGVPYVLRHRQSGLGNLGKMRFTAVAEWRGGPVAREVKALTPSAAVWAAQTVRERGEPAGSAATARSMGLAPGPYYAPILAGAVRAHDPFLRVEGGWIVRRLAPDCRRFNLRTWRRNEDLAWVLYAMGFETANVHLGSVGASKRILAHLATQPKSWLRKAAEAMEALVSEEYSRVRKA